MADAIEPISDYSGQSASAFPWVRWAGMAVLVAIVVAALCNLFGQRATTQSADGLAASISVHAPSTVRPGLIFQAAITISVDRELRQAQLILGRGWIDGLTLNTAEPAPAGERAGPDGSLVLNIGTLHPGTPYTQYLAYQVNPTSSSRRVQTITVRSAGVPAVSLRRTLTIVP